VPEFLSPLTTLVNILSMSGSLWLGIYLVTRSSHSLRSWLAGLALWFLALFFLRNILLIYVPGNALLYRIRLLGMLGLAFWFHVLVCLLPDRGVRVGPVPLSPAVRRGMLWFAYGVGVVLMVHQFFSPAPEPETGLPPITILGRATQFSSPYVAVYIVVIGALSLAVLRQIWKRSRDVWLRRLITAMLAITVPAIAAGLYLTLGPWLYPALPAVPADAVLGVSVMLLGYNVARYDALVEGRTIDRDALYSLAGTGLALAAYGALLMALYLGQQTSFLAVLLVVICAIVSHSVYDGGRSALDRLFYHGQFRQLRANLRALAREAGTGRALPEQLPATLTALCHALNITRGFLAIQQDEAFVVCATEKSAHLGQRFALEDLAAAEIVARPRLGAAGGPEPGLLVPLWAGGAQIGALVLGAKGGAQTYGEADLELLDDVADRIATLLHAWRLQQETAGSLNRMVGEFRQRERVLQHQVQELLAEREEQTRPAAGSLSEGDFTDLVEECLRRLHDFSFLGDHRLAGLQVVGARLSSRGGEVITHIERGKALNAILVEALDRLRPAARDPGGPRSPAREWHQFIILYDAYVSEQLTRDIMGRLNISEPTFHRTRRRAIRGVAKALREMEAASQLLAPDGL
jgi:GAF domain-containing protein